MFDADINVLFVILRFLDTM